MPAIMADHDIEGQMQVLLRLINSPPSHELWSELDIEVESFTSLGIPTNTPDAELWQLCQAQGVVLITGNRNREDATSLEATIQSGHSPENLPVLTVGEPRRILSCRTYAESVVERLIEYLIDIENLRGAGRLYLP